MATEAVGIGLAIKRYRDARSDSVLNRSVMAWFIIILLLAMGTVAISIVLRKKRIKDYTSLSPSSLPTISPKPQDQPTREASFPDVRIVYEDASGDQTERRITPFIVQHRELSQHIATYGTTSAHSDSTGFG
jgi:hypothetical protein